MEKIMSQSYYRVLLLWAFVVVAFSLLNMVAVQVFGLTASNIKPVDALILAFVIEACRVFDILKSDKEKT